MKELSLSPSQSNMIPIKYYPSNSWVIKSLTAGLGIALAGLVSWGTTAAGLLSIFYATGVSGLYSNRLRFEISLLYTIFTSKDWFSIIDNQIIISAIPVHDQVEFFAHYKVAAVLTLLETFELEDGLIHPATAQDWLDKGIDYLQIPAVDFVSLTKDQLITGVEYMHQYINKGKIVLVHCKAGRGRSASMVVAYLLKYGIGDKKFSHLEDAYNYLLKYRNINLNDEQKKGVYQFRDDIS